MRALAREMNFVGDDIYFSHARVTLKTGEEHESVSSPSRKSYRLPGIPPSGTALSLPEVTRAASERPEQIVLDLNVGKVPVSFRPDSANGGVEQVDGKIFGEMRQRSPEFRTRSGPGPRSRSRWGINAKKDIATDGPIQVISTKLPPRHLALS